MKYEARLSGVLSVGGADFGLETRLGEAMPVWRGALRPGQSLSPRQLLDAFFGSSFPLDLSGSGFPALRFSRIEVESASGRYFRFLCFSDADWSAPFGIETGLHLYGLGLSVEERLQPQRQRLIRATGTMAFNSNVLEASCYFQDGRPVLLATGVIERVPSLGDIFRQFFPDGFSWPSDLLDLELRNASVYYLRAGTTLSGDAAEGLPVPLSALREGLHLRADARLTLATLTAPAVTLDVAVRPGQGLRIAADFTEPFSLLELITLTGPSYSGGPSLAAASGPDRAFRLACGLRLGADNFAAGTFDVRQDPATGRTLTGSFTSAGTLPAPFGGIRVDVGWSEAQGLRIRNFPKVLLVGALVDNARYLKYLVDKVRQEGCGQLVNLAFRETIDTQFVVGFSFATKLPEGVHANPALAYLLLRGDYKISVAGHTIATLPLPVLPFGISAPKQFSFEGILTLLGQIVKDNIENVLQALWDDRQALAKLLAVVLGKEALQRLAGQLVCTALKDLLASFAGALPAAGDIFSVLAGAGGAIAKTGGGCSSDDKKKDDDGDSGDSGGGGGGQPAPSRLLPPGALRIEAVTEDWYAASWQKRDDRTAAFEFRWLRKEAPGADWLPLDGSLLKADATRTMISRTVLDRPGNYGFRIVAVAPGQGGALNSDPALATVTRLGQPPVLRASLREEAIHAAWDAVGDAVAYELALEGGTFGLILLRKTVDARAGTAPEGAFSRAEWQALSERTFYLKVRALGGAQTLPGDYRYVTEPIVIAGGIGVLRIGSTFKIP